MHKGVVIMFNTKKKPKHGLFLKISDLNTHFWLWLKSLFLSTNTNFKGYSRLTPREVQALPDLKIVTISIDEIPLLDHNGIALWTERQIDALSIHQIHALTAKQIDKLVKNPNITANQISKITAAFNSEAELSKVAMICLSLQGDPYESEKIEVIGESIIADFPKSLAKQLLITIARSASDFQFKRLLHAIPFNYIKEITEEEINAQDLAEFQHLDLRVEERQLNNSYRAMRMIQDIDALELRQTWFQEGKSFSINSEKAPWSKITHAKVEKLRLLISQWDAEKSDDLKVAVNRLFNSMHSELVQKQIHYQTENCKVSDMIDIWNGEYLDTLSWQCKVLEKIIRPQAQVLDEISNLLVNKGAHKLSEEERRVLRETIVKGIQLATEMSPEVEKGEKYLRQLEMDREFLVDSFDVLLDNIRHETRIGPFTAEFFKRLIEVGNHEEAYHIVHGDRFEQMLADFPEFNNGIKLLYSVLALKNRINILHKRLEEEMEQIPVYDVKGKLARTLAAI
jgi:hypothetical protein